MTPPDVRRRLLRRSLGVGVVAAFVVGAAVWIAGTFTSPDGPTRDATVVRIKDGDTLVVDLDGGQQTVRLIGIDTPETTNGKNECFGAAATAELEALVAGKTVRLEADPTQTNTDRYDRLLRYVEVDGVDVGEHLVAGGWAHEYTYRASDPYVRQDEYIRAAQHAAAVRSGGWDECGW